MAVRPVPFQHPFFNRSRASPWDDPWMEYTPMSHFQPQARILDQHFGQGLTEDDLQPPVSWRGYYVRPRVQRHPSQHSGTSEVSIDGKDFKVMLDVAHFSPEEINVKTVDNQIVVHAKHEDKQDEHGSVKREFTRQYILPQDVDPMTITSSLAADGILTLKAPMKSQIAQQERSIPIQHGGTSGSQ